MSDKCPFCDSRLHPFEKGKFSCGTPVDDPVLVNQTDLCIDRQVAHEAVNGLEEIASALGLKTYLDDHPEHSYPELKEQCLEKIRDLYANQIQPNY